MIKFVYLIGWWNDKPPIFSVLQKEEEEKKHYSRPIQSWSDLSDKILDQTVLILPMVEFQWLTMFFL